MGRGDQFVRHNNTLPRTLEVALAQCGLEEAAQVALLGQRIKEAAEAALAAVLALEAGLSVEQRGGRQVHIDFLGEHWRRGSVWVCGDRVGGRGCSVRASSPGPGVDFVLTVAGRTLTPAVLKLNCGLCLEACGALEGLWAAPRLERSVKEAAAAPLVETMLRRSGRRLMEGKQLLAIGAGGVSKKFVWEAARDYGLKVGGAGAGPDTPSRGMIGGAGPRRGGTGYCERPLRRQRRKRGRLDLLECARSR